MLLHFLGTTLLHRLNHALAREARRLPERDGGALDLEVTVSSEITSVLTQVARDDNARVLNEALAELDESDREILILRGIEGLPHATIAALVGSTVGAVTMRYRRALERLRARLPPSMLEELLAE